MSVRLENRSGLVSQLCRSPDGKKLAGSYAEGHICVWDASTGLVLSTLSDHKGDVEFIDWSPNGQNIVSGGLDRHVRVWNVESGKLILKLAGHTCHIRCVTYSPDGKIIASSGDDRTIRIWDSYSGECVSILNPGISEPSYWIYKVCFSPDGGTIASCDTHGMIMLWNWKTGECLATLSYSDHPIISLCYSPDGKKIAASSVVDRNVYVWDIDRKTYRRFSGHMGPVQSVSYSPDGEWIISISWDNSVRIWEEKSGECMRYMKFSGLIWEVKRSQQFFLHGEYDCKELFVHDIPFFSVSTVLAQYLTKPPGKLSDPRIWGVIRAMT